MPGSGVGSTAPGGSEGAAMDAHEAAGELLAVSSSLFGGGDTDDTCTPCMRAMFCDGPSEKNQLPDDGWSGIRAPH